MDNVNYSPVLLPRIVNSRVVSAEPFVLIDVGCGMGLDEAWRLFEPHLVAYGFDPQVDECARLERAERNPHVHYHAAYVGEKTGLDEDAVERYFNPFGRTSAMQALAASEAVDGHDALREHNAWDQQQLTPTHISLEDFVRENDIRSIDFVKIDTDGGDLGVLRSVESAIEQVDILGFMVETPFTGSASPDANSFHNIDRLLRSHGFHLFTFSVQRYSRAALPAPFRYKVLGSTVTGQTMWGDTVYLRDASSPDYEAVFGRPLSSAKLLKLAALYDLFELPDCAVELLQQHETRLKDELDIPAAIEALTPARVGESASYRAYVDSFRRNPYAFYPRLPLPVERAEVARLARRGAAKVRRRVRSLVGAR